MTPPTLLRRGLARLLDALVLAAAGYGWGLLVDFHPAWLVVHALLVHLYFVAGDTLGTSLGKRLVGLRVTTPTGAAPTWKQSFVREAFVLAGAVPFVGPLIALGLWIAIALTARKSPTGQALHDRWAGGTQVVRA